MNINYYRNFLLAVETGSLSQTAEIAKIAQPAITRQMQYLEKEFGAKLLISGRGKHELKLTDAGWIFYKRAKQLCQIEDETYREIQDYTDGMKGTLTISMAPSRTPAFISKVAVPFTALHPNIRYEIHESFHLQLLDDLLHGVSGFVEHVVTFFVPVVGREEGCGKVADGGLRSLVVHSDGLLCRQRKCAAYKDG